MDQLRLMLTEEQVIDAYNTNTLSCNVVEDVFENPRYWLSTPSLEYLEKASISLRCDFTKYLMSSDPEVKGLALALEWREGFRNEALRLVEESPSSLGVIGALRYLWRFGGLNEAIMTAVESPNLRVVQEAFSLLLDLDFEVQVRVTTAVLPVLFNIRDEFVVETVAEILAGGLKRRLISCELLYERLSAGLEKRSPVAVRVFSVVYDKCLSSLLPIFIDAVDALGSYTDLLRLVAKGVKEVAIFLPYVIGRIDRLTSYDLSSIVNFVRELGNRAVGKEIVSALISRIAREKSYHLLGIEELAFMLKEYREVVDELRTNLEEDYKVFWNAALTLAALAKLEGRDPGPYLREFEGQFKGEKPEWIKALISKLI